MNLDSYLAHYTKINSKWVKDQNVRAKTTKPLKGNMSVNLQNHVLSKFLKYDTKKSNKREIDMLNFIKNKNSCAMKTIIKKVKWQPTE